MDDKLIEAAELIENNFAKDAYVGNNGEYCLHGAVMQVYGIDLNIPGFLTEAHNNNLLTKSMIRLCDAILADDCCCSILDYSKCITGIEGVVYHHNDVHCTGGLDAAKLLRKAAEIE